MNSLIQKLYKISLPLLLVSCVAQSTPVTTPVTFQPTPTSETVYKEPETQTYIVQRGDTLSKIAREHGIILDELLNLNPQYRENPNLIHAGDIVVLPIEDEIYATSTPVYLPTPTPAYTPTPTPILYSEIGSVYPIRNVDILVTPLDEHLRSTGNTYLAFEVEFFEPNLVFKILNERDEEIFVNFITESDYNPISSPVPNLSFKLFRYIIAENNETVFNRSYIIQIEDLYEQKFYQHTLYLGGPNLIICDAKLTRERGMVITVDNIGSTPAFIKSGHISLSGRYEFETEGRIIDPIWDCPSATFYSPPENFANLERGVYDLRFTAEDYEGRILIDYNTRLILD